MSDHLDLTGDPEDAELLDELRAVLGRADPVPPEVVEAARAAFGWRRLDAELAELLHDSSLDEERLAGVRGGVGRSDPRLLTFEAGPLTVEVEVAAVGARRRLVGQLVPAQPAVVEVRHAGGTVAARADELGRFAAGGIEPGPVSLRCRPAAGAAVETTWVNV